MHNKILRDLIATAFTGLFVCGLAIPTVILVAAWESDPQILILAAVIAVYIGVWIGFQMLPAIDSWGTLTLIVFFFSLVVGALANSTIAFLIAVGSGCCPT